MTTDNLVGILLMAYGSPESLDEVEAYYTQIRGRRHPLPSAATELQERYRRIGGRSPLTEITRAQAQALQHALNTDGSRFRVYLGMRHWRPSIREAIGQMAVRDGLRKAVGLALAPHYSRLSVGAYIEAARQALQELHSSLQIRFVESWHLQPLFLAALAQRVRQALNRFTPAERDRLTVVFTAHSLPQRILQWGDPYPAQLHETCREVARQVALSRWRFAYQSASRTGEPWLGPEVLNVLNELAREDTQAVLLCPVGFVADNLEILYDIDIASRQKAGQLGLHLERTDSLNDDPRFIRALAATVKEHQL